MRKITFIAVSSMLMACLGGMSARAQSSGKFFNAVTNLNPIGYWPLSENVQPPATPPVANNLGSLGATGNGQYLGGVFPGVTGALAGSADTAAGFDRSSGRVLVPYSAGLIIPAPFSAEAWVNQAVTNATTECVMSLGSYGSPSGAPADGFYGWAVYVRGNQYNLRLYNTNSTNPSLSISASSFVLPNVWTHVAVTYDGTTASLYLNGVLATNGVPTANLSGLKYVDDDGTSNTLFSVGGRSDDGVFFQGNIDEVAVYGTTLAGSDILAHYQNGTNTTPLQTYNSLVLAKSPILYFRLDEAAFLPTAVNFGSLGTAANGFYEMGTSPGLVDPNLQAILPGALATAFSTNGIQATNIGAGVDCAPLNDHLLDIFSGGANSNCTFCAWVNVTSAPGWFQELLARTDNNSFRVDVEPSGDPHWVDASPDIIGPTSMADGKWHFWCGTFNATNNLATLYIDGALIGSATETPATSQPTLPMTIGCAPDDNGRNFVGSVCHVAIFTTALSQPQVLSMYDAAQTPATIVAQPQNTVAISGSNAVLSVTAAGSGLTYQWSGPSGIIAGATNSTLTIPNVSGASVGNYSVTVSGINGSAANSSTVTLNVVPSLGGSYYPAVIALNPLVYYPLNESGTPLGGATNYGSLGAAGNAGYAGTVTFSQQGALSASGDVSDTDNSINGDGNTDEVVLPYSSALTAVPLTLEGWFNPTAGFNGGGEVLVSDGQVNGNRTGLWIYGGLNGNDFNLRTYIGSGATTGVNIDFTSINPGQWYHVAATVAANPASNSVSTGYISTFYIDGTNVGSGISAFAPNASGAFKIGNRSDEVNFNFAGGMDEVAFYPSALSAATIMSHYQAGTNPATAGGTGAGSYYALVKQSNPLLYYRLDELSGIPLTSQPTATNYGALGANDNAFYNFGTIPAGVTGPKAAGFPGANRACEFINANGYGAFVDDPDTTGLVITGPITMATWIQAGDQGGNFDSYMGRGDASWRGDVDGGNIPHFADAADNGGDLNAATPIGDSKWHFLVGQWDGGGTARIYIDGVLNATQTGLSPNTQSGAPGIDFIMGGVPDNFGRTLQGNLTQVAIFNYNLSAAQIQSLYLAAELAPFITTNPPPSTVIVQSLNGSISAAAAGNPTLSYRWYFNNAPLNDGGAYSGTGTPTLNITGAQTAQSGNYMLVVTNNFGSATSSVDAVTVTLAPFITSQPTPTNISLYSGNQVNYSVGVVGGSLAYQWFNGTNAIAGATSSNFSATAKSGTNTFTVRVTNSFGAATSVVTSVVEEKFVPGPHGFALNFSVGPGSVNPYFGQGAYPDTDSATYTNNFWNNIPAGTLATFRTSIVDGALDSSSNASFSGFVLDWGFNNGATSTGGQGTPGYLVETEDAVNSGSPGIGTVANPEGAFIVTNLPPGNYSVYIYSANFDGDRGSAFTLNNPAAADNGITATTNGSVLGLHNTTTVNSLAEGDNYVFFHNVRPDNTGTISGTFVPILNPISGNNGEGSFNGMQLALKIVNITPPNASGNITINWSGGSLYSGPTVTGPWTLVAGNGHSPLIVTPPLGQSQFFLVY